MPIRPENRDRYPPDWPEIRARVLARARHRCEGCGVYNHDIGYRLDDGQFVCLGIGGHETLAAVLARAGHATAGRRVFRIVLTIAHLDHVPENVDPENLRAWCQKCHLAYDAKHHAQTRYMTRKAAANTLELPL